MISSDASIGFGVLNQEGTLFFLSKKRINEAKLITTRIMISLFIMAYSPTLSRHKVFFPFTVSRPFEDKETAESLIIGGRISMR